MAEIRIAGHEVRVYVDSENKDEILLDIEELHPLDQWVIVPMSVTQAVLLQRALDDACYEIRKRRAEEERASLLKAVSDE